MELNREQIIKALEFCSSGGNCINCSEDAKNPRLSREGCMAAQMRDALALITSQEQRIRELTEENKRLRDERDRYKRYYLNHDYDRMEADIRADTVRKMQEKLHARKVSYGNITFRVVSLDDIDQIAKEMLEGEND